MKTKKPRYATKILALVLSMLMLLGAMPVAFAAAVYPTIEEWPTIPEGTEIVVGQKWGNIELIGGKADVPGHFGWYYPDLTVYVIRDDGTTRGQIAFFPDDTTTYKTKRYSFDVKARKADNPTVEGTVTANVPQGKTLSEAVITPSDDFGIRSYDTLFKTQITWENPDKIMSTVGTFTEKAIVTGLAANGNPLKETSMDSLTVDVTINVQGAADVVEVQELPVASEIHEGQTLADSVLTGGRVTKGGVDVAGSFAWKDSTIAPKLGTRDYAAVFTPDDSAACDSFDVSVSVRTTIAPLEVIEWPTVKCQYLVDGYIRECAVLEGEGKANKPGEFKIDMDYFAKIPADTKMTDTFEVKVTFKPTSYSYEPVSKMIAVKFVPCDPRILISAEPSLNGSKGAIKVSGAVMNSANWDQHTGKFYYVLDGVSTEIEEYRFYNEYNCDNLAIGTHTAYAEYIPGENDVYAPFKTKEITFNITGYYDVIVTDCTGTYTLGNYKAGDSIGVYAAPHENAYYEFSGWTAEGAEITEHSGLENAALYFTMPDGEVHLTANYKFNFKLFLEDSFTKVVVWLKDIVTQGIEWIKGLRP